MQFYEFDRSPGYESLECVDFDARFDILLALDGSSRAANWKPFQVRRIKKSRRRPFRDDVPRFLTKLMLSLYKADLPIRRSEHFVLIALVVEDGECDMQVQKQLPASARKSLQKAGQLPM